MHIYIYIYTYIYIHLDHEALAVPGLEVELQLHVAEVHDAVLHPGAVLGAAGQEAPVLGQPEGIRNHLLAPRNHFLARIVEPSGYHCTDGHLTSRVFTEDQHIS